MSRMTISINEETSINRSVESALQVGVVLESPRGPVVTPTTVTSEADLIVNFGESTVNYPVLSLIRAYLKQYTSVMISRIKYKDAVASKCIINDTDSSGLITVTGNSFSDYENDQTLVVTDDESTGLLSVTIKDSEGVVRSNITGLPATPKELVTEYNSKSQSYKMELTGDGSKSIKLDEDVTFSGGVQGSSFDKNDVIDAIKSFDTVNIPRIDILLAPGLNSEIDVVNSGLEVATNRGETIYLADFPEGSDYDTMISTVTTYKSSDALACYYPSVIMAVPTGSNNLTKLTIPASAAALFTWAKATETSLWSCPAGYSSDFKLPNTTGTAYNLSTKQANEMYEATDERPAVNPVIFDNTIGYLVDGQRSTAKNTSIQYPLNVSRLVKHVWYITKEVSKPFSYKPNTDFTWSEWKLAISSKLTNIKNSAGIQEYEVNMGLDITMTQDEINQGIMRGIIRIRPMFVAEYITINIGLTTEVIGGEE